MRILIMAVALLLFGGAGSTVTAQLCGLEKGNKAPEIRLPSIKGDTVSLYSLKGK